MNSIDSFKIRVWDNDKLEYIPEDDFFLRSNGCMAFYEGKHRGEWSDARYTKEICLGSKDKTGKLIYNGDILDISESWWNAGGPAGYDSPIVLVQWNEEYCGFFPFANYDCDCGVYHESNESKIIGNIHENPELLED